jgi:hypothetical protein
MKKNLLISSLALITGVALFYCYYGLNYKHTEYQEEVFTGAIGLLSFSLGGILDYFFENRRMLMTSFKCLYTPIRNQQVYVSLSYLCKIKIEGLNKYLLVRGAKIQYQYQPVGGVYKRFDTAKKLFRDWEAKSKEDINNPDDLRFFVLGKHIPEVIKWFFSRKNREVDVWREVFEELLKTAIVDKEIFCHVQAEYLKSHCEYLIKRDPFKCRQVLIYDIYEINLGEKQKKFLLDLYNTAHFTDKYVFVSEEEIAEGRFIENNNEYKIGNHSKQLI